MNGYNNGSSGGNRPPQKFVGAANNPYLNKNKYSSGIGSGGLGGGIGSSAASPYSLNY